MIKKPTYKELEQRIQELEQKESEHKQLEEEFHYKIALFEAQLDASIDGIIVVDVQGKKTLQNQKAVELWKIPQHIADSDNDETQVQHVMHMTRNPEQFVEKVSHLYKHHREKSRDEIELKNGTVLDRYSAPVIGKDGENFGRIWTFRDITERKKAEKALIENEFRYKRAQRMGQVGNWEYNLSTEKFWGSDETKRIYGVDPEEINFTIDKVENCILDRERVHQALLDLIDKGQPYDLEFEIRTITGPVKKNIKSIAEVIKNDSGIPIKVVGVIQDITDRRLADEDLRKSEEKYRNLLKTTSEGFWLLNHERETVEVNQALCKMLGYSQNEMLGKAPFDFADDENRKVFIEQTSKISTTGNRSYEIVLRTKKGDPLHTYFNATTLKDESGNVKGSFALITDITENKRIAEELRESEEKYRTMMEAMEDPIYICSPNYRVEYMNPAMIRSIGTDVTGESCSKSIYGLDKKCPWCVHEKIQKGEPVFTEIFNPKDGHTYHVSHSPIFHADNSISKMTIFRDITKRKLLEEEREKLIRELQNALAEIKTLSGLLPICSYCKKIRDDKGYWSQIESYIQCHTDAEFSHGICRECADKYYPDIGLYDEDEC